MICFGAIIVEPELKRSLFGQQKSISDKLIPKASAVSGFTRKATIAFDDPQSVTFFVPSGTFDNSPPFQRWVVERIRLQSPVRHERVVEDRRTFSVAPM